MRLRVPLPPVRSAGSTGIGAFIAIPLFFSSLMASTLALEKPRLTHVVHNGHVRSFAHDPSTATVARVWLWALVPPLVLVALGFVASRVRFGFYATCVAAILIAMAVVHRTAIWERHHTARYPVGVDLIPPSDPASNKYDRGQWEHMARETALSLQHWTIGLALASIVVSAALMVRRRYFARRRLRSPSGELESVHAPDATLPSLG